jgi:hypothetical protein
MQSSCDLKICFSRFQHISAECVTFQHFTALFGRFRAIRPRIDLRPATQDALQ